MEGNWDGVSEVSQTPCGLANVNNFLGSSGLECDHPPKGSVELWI